MEIHQTSLDKLTAAFKALGVQAPSLLTKIGILRALFVEIELAKKYGYSYGVILETLIANGLKATTPNQFYGLMNRIRLERGFTNERDAYRAQVAELSVKIATAEKREALSDAVIASGAECLAKADELLAQKDAEIALAGKYFAALESL